MYVYCTHMLFLTIMYREKIDILIKYEPIYTLSLYRAAIRNENQDMDFIIGYNIHTFRFCVASG